LVAHDISLQQPHHGVSLVSDSISAVVVVSHHLRFPLLARLRLGSGLILGYGLRLGCRLILSCGLRFSHRLVLCHRLRLGLTLHHRLGLRGGLVLHDYRLRFRRDIMMHHHMLRAGFMVYYHRMVGYAASIVAQTQGKVIAAAESYHYYAGHQEHFKHILFDNF
jgi:hypothetical protein